MSDTNDQARLAAAKGLGKMFSGGGDSGAGGIASATPYGAAFNAAMSIANSPPPSSAAKLNESIPINVTTNGINLGSILQPFTSGQPSNGSPGYNVRSPMGSISSTGVMPSKTILYIVAGLTLAGGAFLVMR